MEPMLFLRPDRFLLQGVPLQARQGRVFPGGWGIQIFGILLTDVVDNVRWHTIQTLSRTRLTLIEAMARCLSHQHPRQPRRNPSPVPNVVNRCEILVLHVIQRNVVLHKFRDPVHGAGTFSHPFGGVQSVSVVHMNMLFHGQPVALRRPLIKDGDIIIAVPLLNAVVYQRVSGQKV